MDKEMKKFLESLTLQTPLSEIKKHCTGEEQTKLIMNHLYKLMSREPSGELSEDLKFTFAGEKAQKPQKKKITASEWRAIMSAYYNEKDEVEKRKAFEKIVQLFEGNVEVEKEKKPSEGQIKLFLETKRIFSSTPKKEITTALIQKRMKIGYSTASRVKDYLLGEDFPPQS